ncbi:S8 family peptidase [Roseibium aggregatum]|uniref:S8/S53 family peptidase n=1 Tax=Roseibium aggregatum TaxID=187304 RepID=A0A939EI59_9HYPH|nr:S8/S53 family peptidase [Roseibium aggregatum]MBN9673131.1 S8/S53 family peptidase [Roseibium aggregatum]
MEDFDFRYLVFFDSTSSEKFNTFKNEENIKGRMAVEQALQKKKSIKSLFKELPGRQGISIAKSGKSFWSKKADNLVLPFPKVEAMAVRNLDDEQISFLSDRDVLVIPNTRIKRLTHVRRQDLKHQKPLAGAAWHIPAVLGNTKRENVGKGIRFGVIDTGANIEHPEFFGRKIINVRVRGHRIDRNEGPHADPLNHGTLVASLIAGRNVGLCPEADVAVCDVFEDEYATALDILQAISWLADNPFGDGKGIDIINLSLGIQGYDEVFRSAIKKALKFEGILFVSAIGNDHHKNGPCCSPACYSEVLSVGAYGKGNVAADFSNCGLSKMGHPEQPDLWAPGVDVYAASSDGFYDFVDGTSFSSPLAAAAAGRIIFNNPKCRRNPMSVSAFIMDNAEVCANFAGSKKMLKCPV